MSRAGFWPSTWAATGIAERSLWARGASSNYPYAYTSCEMQHAWRTRYEGCYGTLEWSPLLHAVRSATLVYRPCPTRQRQVCCTSYLPSPCPYVSIRVRVLVSSFFVRRPRTCLLPSILATDLYRRCWWERSFAPYSTTSFTWWPSKHQKAYTGRLILLVCARLHILLSRDMIHVTWTETGLGPTLLPLDTVTVLW